MNVAYDSFITGSLQRLYLDLVERRDAVRCRSNAAA